MPLQVYNTLTHQKEEFHPRNGRRVDMFVCGITPYDSTHMGHARTYVAFDVVARYLRYKGYRVFYLQNVTDIDDRIINRARERGVTEDELAEKYFGEYLEVMRGLGVTSVNLYARATDYIPEIIEQIEGLTAKGYAYAVEGDVYFEVSKFRDFGKLSRVKREALEAGARVAVDERKRDPQDFALWKSRKPGEPAWDSPWGPGRPGWHIEDTSITVNHFGPSYDLHGGGIDLIFPHHEAEISQAEAYTGVRPLVHYWMHTGHLTVSGERMGKSMGNMVAAKVVLEKFPATVLRFYFVNVHYRSPQEYSDESMEEAQRALARLREVTENLRAAATAEGTHGCLGDDALARAAKGLAGAFEEAMDDDFNTREAIAALFTFATEANQALAKGISPDASRGAVEVLDRIDGVLGVLSPPPQTSTASQGALLDVLAEARDRARRDKAYGLSDWIRSQLGRLGYVVEDAAKGTKIRQKPP